jgi:hypothetical protein
MLKAAIALDASVSPSHRGQPTSLEIVVWKSTLGSVFLFPGFSADRSAAKLLLALRHC